MPVLLALSAVVATMGLVALPSHIFPIDDATSSVIVLIGMAVGVDYSLFYMRREREERAAGHDTKTAVQRAAATSGRAVLISGLTVMTAMAGMFFSGDKTFIGIGLGALIVVGVAMIGSLTVLPAMMAWLGDRVEKGRIPFFGRRRAAARESRLWGAIVDRVLKRPLVSAAVAGAILIALTIPAFGLNTVQSSASDYPQDLPALQSYNAINEEFPGKEMAATVVIEDGDVRQGDAAQAIAELKEQALASGQMYEPIETRISDDHTVAEISIPLAGDGGDQASKDALSTLRDEIIPATVGQVATVNVSGQTAQSEDADAQLAKSMPIVFGFVLILAFGLLLVTFRSIVVPIKAIVLNLLSVGAAYGVLKLVFQDGMGEGLLDFNSNGGIAPWLPLFLFVVLFGLSMDYHVFILSRVREAVDRGMSTDEAVSHGIKTTAGTVTSAAIVMVAVFSIFATLSMIDFKQMGVGLAVAVLIDATIIRAVLLPASMKLLGERNWYLPKFLRWMPTPRPRAGRGARPRLANGRISQEAARTVAAPQVCGRRSRWYEGTRIFPGGSSVQRKIFTVVATSAVLAAVAASPSSAVVGGSDAAPGEFPSVAEITFGAFGCTGTLIDPTHVLSAGHCGSADRCRCAPARSAGPPR